MSLAIEVHRCRIRTCFSLVKRIMFSWTIGLHLIRDCEILICLVIFLESKDCGSSQGVIVRSLIMWDSEVHSAEGLRFIYNCVTFCVCLKHHLLPVWFNRQLSLVS